MFKYYLNYYHHQFLDIIFIYGFNVITFYIYYKIYQTNTQYLKFVLI